MRRSNIHHLLERQNFFVQPLEAALSSGHRFSHELQFMGRLYTFIGIVEVLRFSYTHFLSSNKHLIS